MCVCVRVCACACVCTCCCGVICVPSFSSTFHVRRLENPRIVLLDCPLEYKKGESMVRMEGLYALHIVFIAFLCMLYILFLYYVYCILYAYCTYCFCIMSTVYSLIFRHPYFSASIQIGSGNTPIFDDISHSLIFSLDSNFSSSRRIEPVLSLSVSYTSLSLFFFALLHVSYCRGSANQQRKCYLLGKNRSNTGYKTTNTDSYTFNYVVFT